MAASDVITELRKKLKITPLELANRIGLKSRFIIWQYEQKNRFPSHLTWMKIVKLAEEAGMTITTEMMKD